MQWSYSSCCLLSMTQFSTDTTLPAPSWELTLMSWTMQVSATNPLTVTCPTWCELSSGTIIFSVLSEAVSYLGLGMTYRN